MGQQIERPDSAHQKSFELIIGLVGIVVGLVGIYITVLTFPGALDAVGSAITGSGLPPSFKGLAGGLTLFSVILCCLLALVALFAGLTCVFALMFSFFGVESATIVGAGLSGFLYWAATGVTLGLFNSDYLSPFAFVSAATAVAVWLFSPS
ncbi:hypothetical protein RLW55_16755 [Hyphomicrobium sp. B1]|uniref:hypothetical protein n=1 Tax=Hyphomicrobium sp. B1 TaxID=3075651 RepID=UPI003C2D5DA4